MAGSTTLSAPSERLTTARTAPPQPGWLVRGPAVDVVSVLTVWLVLLFALPERLVFPPLGAAGAPAGIVAWLIAAWWGLNRLVPTLVAGGRRQPLRQVLVVLFWVLMLSYLWAMFRGLPGVQQRAADRFILGLLGASGVALVLADGIPSRERLDAFLKRVTVAGAALGLMGLAHNTVGFVYTSWIKVPVLELNRELFLGVERGNLERISGTASHPIAYGVTLAMILPLAVHYALVAPKGRERLWRIAIATTIGIAIPVSLSRSGALAVAAGLLVPWLSWSWRRRVNALGVVFAGIALVQAVLPGRLMTLFTLFTNPDVDGSVRVRTSDYELAFDYIFQRPFLGLGPGTFLPSEFLQLDNQALKFMLEVGFVGVMALILLYATGVRLALSARLRSSDPQTRNLCVSLIGTITAAFVVLFTFDAYTYSFYVGVLFVVLGAAAALYRLPYGDPDREGSASPADDRAA